MAAWQAVSWPRLLKVALFGPKNAVFLAQDDFFVASLKTIVTIMTGHLKDRLFVLTVLQGGLWEAVQVLFGPKIGLKV